VELCNFGADDKLAVLLAGIQVEVALVVVFGGGISFLNGVISVTIGEINVPVLPNPFLYASAMRCRSTASDV
jgi:hypothetical protein